MAAPMTIRTLRIFRQVSRVSFAAHLRRSNVYKPQVRLISSRVTTQSTLSAPLDGIVEQEDNPTTKATSETSETSATSPQEATDAEAPKTIPISHERAHQTTLLLQQPDQPPDARILKVAIIGSPNAGKSTLINRLMGQRVCSVSSKVHTTQTNALAVLTMDSTQIVLLDTPGMVNHKQGRKHQLARSLLVDPQNSLHEADVALVLVDASNTWTREKISNEILMSLKLHPRLSSILVLNKVDLINAKSELFELTAKLTEGCVEGQRFTLDDRTARYLGKVDTRPMLSHKYKPRIKPSDNETDDASLDETDRTVDSGIVDPVEKFDDDRTSINDHREGNNLSSEEISETGALDSRLTNVSEKKSESTLETPNSSSVGGQPELPPTLKEYIDTLEGFSSKSLDFDDVPHPQLEPAETDDAKNIERAKYRKLLQEVGKRSGWDGFGAVFMVSALDGEGLEDVKEHLVSKAVPGDWEYHRSVVTNLSPDEVVREAIREKLLEYLPQEVPYNISQKNELWATETSGRLRIVQLIICQKRSHVKLLKKNIGKIAREAEQELMSAFQCDVYLSLRIMRR
ncbi:GTPase Era, mitochondrial-like [Patiria miniata]|uniref:GTPase Era, mitochondrial n=1 Tax=Patiria miniata TaxID=46514 RepID=A0A914A7W1_PATMI|nr:GTPase Era, mitochondrial-like [Patiria miniata]